LTLDRGVRKFLENIGNLTKKKTGCKGSLNKKIEEII
jgi:hypothetical protein